MMSQQPAERKKLVVDTGVFTRIKQLSSFGYEKYYTVEGVIREIRDHAARQNLEFQSDVLQVISPSKEDLCFVRRFAKLSGDLGFLSETDIHVIALTCMLQRETNSAFKIMSEPNFVLHKTKIDNVSTLQKNVWGLTSTKKEKSDVSINSNQKDDGNFEFKNGVTMKRTDQCNKKEINLVEENKMLNSSLLETNSDEAKKITNSHEENCDKKLDLKEVEKNAKSCEMQRLFNDLSEEETDDDEDCWLSQDNFHLAFGPNTSKTTNDEQKMQVACLTTDYTIQNVLIQMGLSVLSLDGYRISEAKQWILLCRACRQHTLDATRKFCSHCGNNTVYRAALRICDNGHAYVEDFKPRLNLRGKIYSIPKPKGGRKGDLILSEDQMFIGNRQCLQKHYIRQVEKEKVSRNPFNLDNTYDPSNWLGRGNCRVLPQSLQVAFGPGNPNSNRWQKRKGKNRT
ncbi:uncharacterized protein LOC128883514 isoform X2 [Hylaeus volcanicus]|uniref:uncharacterized protein LOC128883514 isoform X2 n=1 Tax=Hylaeus volcanicus TaxID=313075 RepID=UPI0023B7AD8E|nr:uncharacterized protein LOC128883514 isoform X2 [Hylaeus volcanicus]